MDLNTEWVFQQDGYAILRVEARNEEATTVAFFFIDEKPEDPDLDEGPAIHAYNFHTLIERLPEHLRKHMAESAYIVAYYEMEQRGSGFVDEYLRRPNLEDIILLKAGPACQYARDVLGRPWPEAEEIIASDPEWLEEYEMFKEDYDG